jgi:hypothetical protein
MKTLHRLFLTRKIDISFKLFWMTIFYLFVTLIMIKESYGEETAALQENNKISLFTPVDSLSGVTEDASLNIHLKDFDRGLAEGLSEAHSYQIDFTFFREGSERIHESKLDKIDSLTFTIKDVRAEKTHTVNRVISIPMKDVHNYLKSAGRPKLSVRADGSPREFEVRGIRIVLYPSAYFSSKGYIHKSILFPTPELIQAMKQRDWIKREFSDLVLFPDEKKQFNEMDKNSRPNFDRQKTHSQARLSFSMEINNP